MVMKFWNFTKQMCKINLPNVPGIWFQVFILTFLNWNQIRYPYLIFSLSFRVRMCFQHVYGTPGSGMLGWAPPQAPHTWWYLLILINFNAIHVGFCRNCPGDQIPELGTPRKYIFWFLRSFFDQLEVDRSISFFWSTGPPFFTVVVKQYWKKKRWTCRPKQKMDL